MRILFVTCVLPHPSRSGTALMASQHIRHLAARHSIHLISFANRNNPEDMGKLTQWCDHLEVVTRPSRPRILMNATLGIIRDPHSCVSWIRSRRMKQAVEFRLKAERYDVVLFQLLQSAQFRPSGYTGRTVWTFEAPLGLKIGRELPVQPWYSVNWMRHIADRVRRYEKRQAANFDRLIYLNGDVYSGFAEGIDRKKLASIPYGVETETFSPSPQGSREPGMIVLSGNMFHPPNVDAVEYFCEEIFPLVLEKEPEANLWIVGANPVRAVRKWSKHPRIRVTGLVSDVREYLQRAMVSVCPLRAKVGILTKILEAMACGTPVVATSGGNCGLDGVSGEHLYVADEAQEFANKVVSLLRGEKWGELSRNGRSFVVENHSWEKSSTKLEQILQELADENATGAPEPPVLPARFGQSQ
jgi:polysaccharide biosynthesis protein PslH